MKKRIAIIASLFIAAAIITTVTLTKQKTSGNAKNQQVALESSNPKTPGPAAKKKSSSAPEKADKDKKDTAKPDDKQKDKTQPKPQPPKPEAPKPGAHKPAPSAPPAAPPAPAPQPKPPTPPAPPASRYDVGPPDRMEIIELVNNERVARGLAPLTAIGTMHAGAQAQSDYMASVNKMTHEGGLQRLKQHTPSCGAAAENVQYNVPGATSRDAFILWKNSASHLQNMLGAYARTGVGIAGKNGWYYITMHYCS